MSDLQPTDGRALRIVFIGSAISEELCRRSEACAVSGNKYQLGLIRGLETMVDQPVHVISVWPVATYPQSRTMFYAGGSCQVGNFTRARLVPFLNLPVLKQVTVLLSIFVHLSAWLWRQRKANKRVVLVYNVFSPFSLSVLGATTVFGGTPVAIVADLPHNVYDFKGALRSLLQRIDFYVQTHSIARFAAIIPLTHQIAQDFAPTCPALVVEGGVETHGVKQEDVGGTCHQSAVPEHVKVVLYTGALNDINGVELLIQAFRLLSHPQYRVHIFGRGPLESMVREAAAQDKRIIYGGVLPNAEIKRIQAQATVLVNPRPSYRTITRYTFPSKLLEYLASGRPVITTALPGIPEEYYPYVYLLRNETPEGLACLIQEVCSKDPAELERFGQRAREFVLQNKNWTRQGQRIYEFVSAL